MAENLPLEGLSVIDFGDAWSSPFACTILGDAGAEVIRVEDVHRQLSTLRGPVAPNGKIDGYPERDPGEHPWNRYYLFNNSERNKLGVTLDIRDPVARTAFDDLVRTCDVFATNYTPRAIRQLGLTFDDLKRINPQIIYAHVTGYGCEGDLSDSAALGSTIDAWAGHMGLRGYTDTTPYDTALSYVADSVGATTLIVALMAALEERDRTKQPQCIELALAETLIEFLAQPLMQTVISGDAPTLYGNRSPDWAPQGVYPCAGEDRWLSIATRDETEWIALCDTLGLWAERETNLVRRFERHDEIDRLISELTREWEPDKLMLRLQEKGVPAMVVYLDSEIFAHPEFTGGDFLEEVFHHETGSRLYPGPLWGSQNRPMRIRSPHYGLGEHNHQVLCDQLGWTEDTFAELSAKQVIGTKYSFWPPWPSNPTGDDSGAVESGNDTGFG